jgi:hypothetical protein
VYRLADRTDNRFYFLKKPDKRLFELPLWFVVSIYLIYNIGLFGLFMGFPVFHVLLGLPAGYYFGRRIGFENIKPENHAKSIKHVSWFTGLIMVLICIPY